MLWAGNSGTQTNAARFFLVEVLEIMCEKKGEVKQGFHYGGKSPEQWKGEEY